MKVSTILLSCSLLFSSSIASAAVIVENDFNTDATGFVDRLNTSNAWTAFGAESTLSAISGGQSLLINRGNTANPAPGVATFFGSAFDDNPSYQGEAFNIQFDFNQVAGKDSFFRLYDGSSTEGITINFRRAGVGDTLQIRDNIGFQDTGIKLVVNTWYHFDLTIVPENNAGTDSFQLVVTDGTNTLVNSTFNFRNNLTSYNFADWRNASGTSTHDLLIDNVSLTVVPEPAEYAIWLGAVTLGFILIRRRIRM